MGATFIIISAITPPPGGADYVVKNSKIRICERDSDAPLPWSEDTESKA